MPFGRAAGAKRVGCFRLPRIGSGSRPGYPLPSLSGSRAAFHVIFQSLNLVTARNTDCYEVKKLHRSKRRGHRLHARRERRGAIEHVAFPVRRPKVRTIPADKACADGQQTRVVYEFFLHDSGRNSVGESVCPSDRRAARAGRQSSDTLCGAGFAGFFLAHPSKRFPRGLTSHESTRGKDDGHEIRR